MTTNHTPAPPADDRTELRQTVTLLRYAVVFFDVAWFLVMLARIHPGESVFWTFPVAVVAFLVAQGLVALTWRTPPWKRRAR